MKTIEQKERLNNIKYLLELYELHIEHEKTDFAIGCLRLISLNAFALMKQYDGEEA